MGINKIKAASLKIISYYTGYIIIGISALMIIPIITSILFKEWAPMLDFIISMTFAVLIGFLLLIYGYRAKKADVNVQWKHGFSIAALSWILLMLLCALPYYFSGHSMSYLDSCFDVMSGFTTTGIVLTQDLDHLSNALNMWRHMLTFIGGQGMIVLGLTFLTNKLSGAYRIYVGEAKDIELVPNVKGTTRMIWKISMIYLAISTLALWINGLFIGLRPVSSLLHALYISESAWSTGGFAPNSQNIMYYHSFSYEIISIIIMVLGSLNFGLHYAVWQGKKKEIVKNIEVQSFFVTSVLCCFLALAGLAKLHVYPDIVSGIRRIIFNVLSAHTTTGFGSIYARQFALEWGDFGIMIMVIAMMIGGSACSTAGGFKGLRVGIVAKGLIADVKKIISSDKEVKVYKYHHIKDNILDDGQVRSAATIIICYMLTLTIGTLIGVYYGYPFAQSAFETASATGNVGFTIGISTPSTPALLKIYYIIAMYLGRLEFLSVFALIGYAVGGIKRTCQNILKH